jgi:Holliday junction resolvase RusA-like endonuclease
MKFTIPGPPVGKGRPRATTINGMARMYTPKATTSYEGKVCMSYLAAGGTKLDGMVRMSIVATFEMPPSWSLKKRLATDRQPCGKKPDMDNLAKVICDALNGVAYHDDAAVVFLQGEKRWGQDGSVVVEIEAI